MARNFLTRHSLSLGILLVFLLTWPIDLAAAGVVALAKGQERLLLSRRKQVQV